MPSNSQTSHLANLLQCIFINIEIKKIKNVSYLTNFHNYAENIAFTMGIFGLLDFKIKWFFGTLKDLRLTMQYYTGWIFCNQANIMSQKSKMEKPIKTKLTGSSGTIAYLSVGDTQVFPAQEIA